MTNETTTPPPDLPAALRRLEGTTSTIKRTLLAPGVQLRWRVDRHSDLSARTVVGLLVKAVRLSEAIKVLGEARNIESASIILRSLFELGVLHKFVNHPEKAATHAQMFHAFSTYQWVKMLEKWTPSTPEVATELANLRALYEQQTVSLPAKPSVTNHWSGGSLESIAGALGQGPLYQSLFRLTSRHVHHSDLNDLVEFTDEGLSEKAYPMVQQDQELARVIESAANLLARMAFDTALGGGVDSPDLRGLLSLTETRNARDQAE